MSDTDPSPATGPDEDDPTYVEFLKSAAEARKPVVRKQAGWPLYTYVMLPLTLTLAGVTFMGGLTVKQMWDGGDPLNLLGGSATAPAQQLEPPAEEPEGTAEADEDPAADSSKPPATKATAPAAPSAPGIAIIKGDAARDILAEARAGNAESAASTAEPSQPVRGSFVMKGVLFSPAHKTRALAYVNTASKDELTAAGVRPAVARSLVDMRPIRSLKDVAYLSSVNKAQARALFNATE